MDHKALVSSLPPDQRAALTRRSDAAGLAHLAGHVALIAVLAWAVAAGVWGWPVLTVALGVALIFLFTLQHECTHKTPFESEALNDAVMRVCGFLIFLPPEHFRWFHMAHHKWTNDPEKDPELAGARADTWPHFLLTITGLPVWRFHLALILRCAAGRCDDGFIPARRRAFVMWEARAMLADYAVAGAALAMGATWIFWCWLGPLLLGQPFLRLYLMAEHGRCPAVANMLENSRTTYTNRLVRFLAWNMPYHAEHHAYPNVPFHQLPAFHRLAQAHLVNTSDGYLAYHAEAAARRQ